MSTSHPTWIPYSPDDPAWTPDKSPDKSGSERWTGADEGDLVTVDQLDNHNYNFLPGVYIAGRDGEGKWYGGETAYQLKAVAKRYALAGYRAEKQRIASLTRTAS